MPEKRREFAAITAALLSVAAATCSASGQSRGVTCLVEPREVVEVSAPVDGVVAEVSVDRGDRVVAGAVIARLASEVEEASVALARARARNEFSIRAEAARVDFLEAQERRQATLAARNTISAAALEEAAVETEMARQTLGEARLQAEIARLELAQAEALLRQKTIVSPIDGVVVERLLSPGEYRNEQSHLVTVAALDPLRVEVFAPVDRYGAIAVGDVATVMPEAPIGGAHRAVVEVVDPVLDVSTSTFGVRLALPNPDLAIPAGLRCEIAFDGGAGAAP